MRIKPKTLRKTHFNIANQQHQINPYIGCNAFIIISYIFLKKFTVEGKKAKEGLGNLLGSCLYSIHLDMIVQR